MTDASSKRERSKQPKTQGALENVTLSHKIFSKNETYSQRLVDCLLSDEEGREFMRKMLEPK